MNIKELFACRSMRTDSVLAGYTFLLSMLVFVFSVIFPKLSIVSMVLFLALIYFYIFFLKEGKVTKDTLDYIRLVNTLENSLFDFLLAFALLMLNVAPVSLITALAKDLHFSIFVSSLYVYSYFANFLPEFVKENSFKSKLWAGLKYLLGFYIFKKGRILKLLILSLLTLLCSFVSPVLTSLAFSAVIAYLIVCEV